MTKFDTESEATFKKLYESLGEKDSRRLAGSLYQLSGSLSYICELLNVSHKTVQKGLAEMGQNELPCPNRQREKGAGRKPKWNDAELNAAFNEVIQPYIAGDPMDPRVKWTNLSRIEIVELLQAKGFKISKNTLGRVLKHNGFKKRKIQKRKSLKTVEDRDAQFGEIHQAREDFARSGDPVVSIDTKKKRPLEKTHERAPVMPVAK